MGQILRRRGGDLRDGSRYFAQQFHRRARPHCVQPPVSAAFVATTLKLWRPSSNRMHKETAKLSVLPVAAHAADGAAMLEFDFKVAPGHQC
jgi:hypothetical protein